MTTTKANNQIKELIVKAQNGDISARTKVLEFATPRIQKITNNIEIQSNSILKISRGLNSFDVTKVKYFLNWVSVIVKNEKRKEYAKNYERESKICRFSEEYEYLYQISNKVQAKEFEFNTSNISDLKSEVVKILEELKPAQNKAFKLWAFEALDHAEISEFLGVHEGTSKSNLNRARTNIKLKLKKRGYEFN